MDSTEVNGSLQRNGYQSFPAAPAPPQTTVTAITNGYTRQPLATAALPQQHPNGTFHPATLPNVTGQLTTCNTLQLQPGYPQRHNGLSQGPSPGYLANQTFRPGYTRSSFHPKGQKRKAEDTLSTDSGDSGTSRSEGSTASGDVFLQPLYCKVCRVTLNAAAQAKQHFEGKSHAKKVKLTDSSSNSTPGTTTSSPGSSSQSSVDQAPSSPKEAAAPPPEINPEIYCKICGVSFNSTKQAQQHYQGKNHAKKTRVSDGDKGRGSYRRGFRYRCFLCNLHLGSKEHLLIHLRGPRHQEKLKAQGGNGLGALGGRWQHHKDLPNGVPFGITQISNGTFYSRHHGNNNAYQQTDGAGSKAVRDFTMYRTPSGKFYCPSCNITLNSETLFSQHVESRKHKMSNSTQQSKINVDIVNNNNNNSKDENPTPSEGTS